MEDKEKTLEYFFIETKPDYSTEKITSFFTKKNVTIKEFIKDKSSDKLVSYMVGYIYNPESLITIELVKKQKAYEGVDFKITNLVVRSDFMEIVKEKIKEDKDKKFTYPILYDQVITKMYVKQIGAPGVEFINQECLARQRGVLGYMVKTLGKAIIEGKSLMNISLPINVSDFRSQTEIGAFDIRTHSYFLEAGADASNIERMKLVVTNYISSLHFLMMPDKPFNPILGETFQLNSGNSKYYAEQTSHHPPITSYYITNPHFTMWGYLDWDFNMGVNSATGKIGGKFYLQYNDGTLYEVTNPTFYMEGVVFGNTYINFSNSMVIEDKTNNLIAYIRFNPDDRSFFNKLFSKDTYPDFFTGFIANKTDVEINKKTLEYKIDEKLILAKIEGEWARFINIDDVCYWIHDEQKLTDMIRPDFILESDSQFRPDIVLWRLGLEEKAQEAKIYLEEIQRKDRDLRKILSTK